MPTTDSCSAPAVPFATAERADPQALRRQHEKVRDLPWVRAFLDRVPTLCAVLNECRQIVWANRAFLEFVGIDRPEDLLGRASRAYGAPGPAGEPLEWLGQRPGEAVRCIHASDAEGGCGTGAFCWTCGAVQTIVSSQVGRRPASGECRMRRRAADGAEESLDLRVWAWPLEVEGESLLVLSVEDESGEKRRRALERIFFHDVLNTAGGVQVLAHLIADGDASGAETGTVEKVLARTADQLLDEIQMQRTLAAAESGDLSPARNEVQSLEIVDLVVAQYACRDVCHGKVLRVHPDAARIALVTDGILLLRALGNLVKNALEASGEGDEVLVDCRAEPGASRFSVRNPAVIPEFARLQIFQRSFSTKGPGRGLGTYGLRLIVERYLSGEVGFESSPEAGTTFWIVLPREEPDA